MACLRQKIWGEEFVWVVDFTYEGRRCIKSTKTTMATVKKEIRHEEHPFMTKDEQGSVMDLTIENRTLPSKNEMSELRT